ncbi:peroxiredoxin family protein [Polycyclovorans algicola]|uniref:peroxiredoxin family protein n=1 Tax=Polycyclovorans algicola TaxID=616992 RepID=UPI001378F52D|nr:TlpA disulfide reductase family protein [Polycyclovorans algicola]
MNTCANRLRAVWLVVLMALPTGAMAAPTGIPPGSEAPEIAGPMLRGEPLRLSGLRGKVVLVDFWASYCGPCILAMPEINQIRADLHAAGHADAFEVVGVAMDREPEKAEQFLSRVPVDYPIIIDTLGLAAHSYGVWRLPATYLIDAGGTIQRIWYGFGDTFAADIRRHALTYLAAAEDGTKP